MQTDPADELWMDAHSQVTLDELARLSGLPDATLRELVDCGVLEPSNPDEAEWRFCAYWVVTVRTARRLRTDFDVDPDPAALALIVSFLHRIRGLEEELRALQAQIPRRIVKQ